MYNKKSVKFKSVAPKRKVAQTLHRFDRHRAKICPSPNILQEPIFQEPMNRGEYANIGVWVKHALGKSSCASQIPSVVPKKQRITVSVFLSTLRLTACLLKSFRLRFYSHTLASLHSPPAPIFKFPYVCICIFACFLFAGTTPNIF